jgi:hypothetical protein
MLLTLRQQLYRQVFLLRVLVVAALLKHLSIQLLLYLQLTTIE